MLELWQNEVCHLENQDDGKWTECESVQWYVIIRRACGFHIDRKQLVVFTGTSLGL